MSSFAQLVSENRRLAILRFLEGDPSYKLNTSVLQTALDAIGLTCSRDCVATEVAWLVEQGLVGSQGMLGSVTVVSLTPRGADVAAGRAVIPGVKRPEPR